jgi:carbon-monoxide dehydrogenase small subunit
MAFHKITLTVNGESELVEVSSQMTLLEMLREKLVLTGTKNGCAAGECGACTVIMNGEPVNSCLVLAVECDGEEGGVQCGFCTPGVLISARALLDRQPDPGDYEIRDALVGNLCRCTGYLRIIEAVKEAAKTS